MSIFSNIGKGIKNILGSQIGKTITSAGTNLLHDTEIGRKLAAPLLGTAGFMLGGPAGAMLGAGLGSKMSGQGWGHAIGTGLKGGALASLAGAGLGASGMGSLGSSFSLPGMGGAGMGNMTAGQLTGLSGMLNHIPGIGSSLANLTGGLGNLAGGGTFAGGMIPGTSFLGMGSGGGSSLPGMAASSLFSGGGMNPFSLLGGYLGYRGSQDATNQASNLADKGTGYLDRAGQLAEIDPAALTAQEARAKDTLRGAQADRGIFNSGVGARQEAEVMPMVNANLQQLAFQNAMQMGQAYNPMIAAYMGNAGSFNNPFGGK